MNNQDRWYLYGFMFLWFSLALGVIILIFLVSCPPSQGGEFPIKILPDKIQGTTDLQITIIRPGHWPLNPLKRLAMKRRGEKPEPRIGPTIRLKIDATTKIK